MNKLNNSGLVLSLLMMVALGAVALHLSDESLDQPIGAEEVVEGMAGMEASTVLPPTPQLGDYGISAASFGDLEKTERIATPATEQARVHAR